MSTSTVQDLGRSFERGPATAAATVTAAPRRRTGVDRCTFTPRLFPRVFYRLNWLMGRFIWFCTIRAEIIRPELGQRSGAYLIACTHLSHLEPFLMSLAVRRKLDWMTRVEFFAHPACAALLRWVDAFAVRRFGVPVSAIRTSIARLRLGRVIGICPEGGVAVGELSAFRGGPIKRGACLLAVRAGVPIVPVVMLGPEKLNCVGPWLPAKRARLWMAFGEPIYPPADAPDRKAARRQMAEQLQAAYQSLYAELRERYGIRDEDVP